MFNFNKVTHESLRALYNSIKEAEYNKKFPAAIKEESRPGILPNRVIK